LFNRAKIICVANQPPEVPEDTRAFWRRLVIIEFPYFFVGDKKDPYILDKITTPQELSGLLNKALGIIPKLKKTADLSYHMTIDDTRETYVLRSESSKAFIEEYCQHSSWGVLVKKEEVYQAYIQWCKLKDVPQVGKKKLGKAIKAEKYQEDRDSWRGMVLNPPEIEWGAQKA
jgi:putative DNA primase/helicase